MSDPKKERMFQIINIVAVLAASVLVGAVLIQMYRGKAATGAAKTAETANNNVPSPLPLDPAAQPPADPSKPPAPGFTQNITMTVPPPAVELSQRAKVLATEFYCLCRHNCGIILGTCTCQENPGQREQKAFLQALVAQEKSSDEIRAAMVAKYGEAVKVK